MRSLASLSGLLFVVSASGVLAAASSGCSARDEVSVDSSEHAATAATDLAEARQVVALLSGDDGRCSGCHGVTESKLREWGTAMADIQGACLETGADDPNAPAVGLSAKERIDCLRSTPADATSAFAARRLGLFAAGAGGDEFKQLFAEAYPGSAAEYDAFKRKVQMPRSGTPLTAEEFARVKQWVLRGMPQLAEAFGGQTAAGCTPSTTPELAAHIAAMKTDGWGARLADQSTPMFGCGSGSGLACLTDRPDATATYGAPDVPQTLRQLHQQRLASHWWVRSSADGRYIGYGMDSSAKVVDLTKPEGDAGIEIEADYDPYFLPSNDGFAFAGSHESGAIVLCRQSLLADAARSEHPSISLTESKCAEVGQDVYMSIGTALDGSRYFMSFGEHENDDGGNDQTTPLPAAFSSHATTVFTPMVNDGLSYRAQEQVEVQLPGEGDMMLSPSSQLSATRFGDGERPLGYRIRFIKPEEGASGALGLSTPVAAELCMPGQKASFSFDERFVVTHQYVDAGQPGFEGLPAESSNIMIADLVTGKQLRVTQSKAGVFALYPHFRADGWLYFAVRDMNTRQEYVVASDVAIRMAQ